MEKGEGRRGKGKGSVHIAKEHYPTHIPRAQMKHCTTHTVDSHVALETVDTEVQRSLK